MPAKIYSGKELETLQIETFNIPSPKEIQRIIEEKKQRTRWEKEYQEKLPGK